MTASHIKAAVDGASADDRRAIWLILLAMCAFSVQDAVVKKIVEEASVWQTQLIRSIAVLVLLWLFAAALGKRSDLRPTQLWWPIIRGAFMCGAYVCFYASLPFLTLSQASAAFFVGPMLITLFAALLLREPIGPKRIVAIVVGFLGVLCIVQPGGEMKLVALMPVGAAVCYAFGVVLTRWRCRSDPSFALSMVHNAVYTVIAVIAVASIELFPFAPATQAAYPALTTGWAEISLFVFALMLLTACTHIIGMLSSVQAYQISDASRIAPFEYSYLAIVPVLDFAVWGTLPSGMTLLGMLLIAGAGGFVAWREGRPARARPQNYGEIPWSDDSETPIPDEPR